MELPRDILPFFYGALPHVTIDEAYEVLLRAPLPVVAWPQLPQRVFYERSVVQASWGFPGLVLDEPQRRQYVEKAAAYAGLPSHTAAFLLHTPLPAAHWSPAEAAGMHALVSGRVVLPDGCGVKGQLLGPVSLAAQLTDEQQQPLLLESVLFEGLVVHTCLRARLQAEALQSLQRPTIICLDEPFLDVMQSPFMTLDREELLFGLARVLEAIPVRRGLVVRSGTPVAPLVQLPLDVLVLTHWDAASMSDADYTALCDFLAAGHVLGVGIVERAAQQVEAVAQLCVIMKRFLSAGIAPAVLRAQLWVAPAQSLGQRAVADAEDIIAATCATAAAVRAWLDESAAVSAV